MCRGYHFKNRRVRQTAPNSALPAGEGDGRLRDKAFIAEVPELPGCAADGKTHREALANVEGIIQEWIETAHEVGLTVPTPKGRWVFA
jgi:predicted RNase H-like HicB family nuclease